MTQRRSPLATARVGRIVVHAGSDPLAAKRLIERLPGMLTGELVAHEITGRRDVERLVRSAARDARA